jgi:hypothetical protein
MAIGVVCRSLVAALAVSSWACGGGSGGGGGDGGVDDDSGIDVNALVGDWRGPARLNPCDDSVAVPGIGPDVKVAPIELTIDSLGVVQQALIDGQSLSTDQNDPLYPTLEVLDPDRVHINFEKMFDVNTGYSPPGPAMLPGLHGGGMVLHRNSANQVTHAFIYIHDFAGCDMVTGVVERGAIDVPVHDLSDLNGNRSGRSAQFTLQSPAERELVIAFDGYKTPWELNVAIGQLSGKIYDQGGPLDILFGTITVESGLYSGSFTLSDNSVWQMEALLSPDRSFFAGFAYLEAWDNHWHDFLVAL